MICPNCKHSFEPLELNGSQKRGHTPQTFSAWLKSLNGAEPIPHGHHALRYAESIGLPREFVALQWEAFCRSYSGKKKRYPDWPRHFRSSIEGNYFHLWYIGSDGRFGLTTQALQLQRTLGQSNASSRRSSKPSVVEQVEIAIADRKRREAAEAIPGHTGQLLAQDGGDVR
jgi:hypothetical protein